MYECMHAVCVCARMFSRQGREQAVCQQSSSSSIKGQCI